MDNNSDKWIALAFVSFFIAFALVIGLLVHLDIEKQRINVGAGLEQCAVIGSDSLAWQHECSE